MAGCPRCSVAPRRPASPPCPPSSSSPPPPPRRAGTAAGAACRRMPGSVVYLPLPPQQPSFLGARIFPVTTKGVLRGGRLLGARGLSLQLLGWANPQLHSADTPWLFPCSRFHRPRASQHSGGVGCYAKIVGIYFHRHPVWLIKRFWEL